MDIINVPANLDAYGFLEEPQIDRPVDVLAIVQKVNDGRTGNQYMTRYTTVQEFLAMVPPGTDVLWFPNMGAFPGAGQVNIIYVDKGTGLQYFWDGATYIQLSPSPVPTNELVYAANLASFPVTGDITKMYIANDTKLIYQWDGATYVQLAPPDGSGQFEPGSGGISSAKQKNTLSNAGGANSFAASDGSANGANAAAINQGSTADGNNSIAVAQGNVSGPATNSFAGASGSVTNGDQAAAIASGTASNTQAFGASTGNAEGAASTAVAGGTTTNDNTSQFAANPGSIAKGQDSAAVAGAVTEATASNGWGCGTGTVVRGSNSSALSGGQTGVSANNAFASNTASQANGANSHAVAGGIAVGANSVAHGAGSVANGANSSAIGQATTANGAGSTSIGKGGSANGIGTVNISTDNNNAFGDNSVAIGYNSITQNTAPRSIAIGWAASTGAPQSVALIGGNVFFGANDAFAAGGFSTTAVSGQNSFAAAGGNTGATGIGAAAVAYGFASALESFAGARGSTQAGADNSVAFNSGLAANGATFAAVFNRGEAHKPYTSTFGMLGRATRFNEQVHGGNILNRSWDNKSFRVNAGRRAIGNTELFLNTYLATERLVLNNNSFFGFRIRISARNMATGDLLHSPSIKGIVKNVGGVLSLVGTVTTEAPIGDPAMTGSFAYTLTPDSGLGALRLFCEITGSPNIIHWNADIEGLEQLW